MHAGPRSPDKVSLSVYIIILDPVEYIDIHTDIRAIIRSHLPLLADLGLTVHVLPFFTERGSIIIKIKFYQENKKVEVLKGFHTFGRFDAIFTK